MTTKGTVAVRMNEDQIAVVLTAMAGYRSQLEPASEALAAHDHVTSRMETAYKRVVTKKAV